MNEPFDWFVAGILVVVLLVAVAGLAVLIWGGIEGDRASQACQAMGYQSATVFPFRGLAYCHKTVNGTSVTVPLERAGRGE